jgi:transposase
VANAHALRGIVFVLRSGIPWQLLPTEMGCGSGSTCWRRFAEWTQAGVWKKAHTQLLAALGRKGLINLERAVIDCASVRAEKGGAHTGPSPVDRRKKGCKRHVLTDANGLPLVVRTGPANQREDQLLEPIVKSMPPIPHPHGGRPRTKPQRLQGDRGYGFPWIIAAVRKLGIEPLLAPRGSEHGSGLGKTRYVVERTLKWFDHPRRLKRCYETTGAHFQAFHELAACGICANRLAQPMRF